LESKVGELEMKGKEAEEEQGRKREVEKLAEIERKRKDA
jgi:hypothetical protein